jgi:general nucleoside transport system ATP-binding protein
MNMSVNQEPEDLVLRLRGITKRFGDLVANDAIDLDLARGEILALLGENGAGKTTLMNILFGHYVADAGEAFVANAAGELAPLRSGSPHMSLLAGIGMVHQHFTLAENLSALDNIVLGTDSLFRPWRQQRGARRKLAALMDRAGLHVNLDATVATLSVGERQRIEILKALYRDARILILDEPTAVLTPQESENLFKTLRRLASDGLSVVFISHKLAEVMAISDRVMVLRGGRMVADTLTAGTDGPRLAEVMVGRPIPPTVRQPLAPGETVLNLTEVHVPGAHNRPALTDANLRVRRLEIIGIAGVSGNGQVALSNLICGLAAHDHGHFEIFGRPAVVGSPARMVSAGVGRIPEDRLHDGIVGSMAVWENLLLEDYNSARFATARFLRRGAARANARQIIDAFDVRCPGPEAPTRLLSGGNIQKLILGRVLNRHPDLILANQPTRGLDIGAVTYVHQRLLEARGAGAGIVLISEDLDELLTVSDRIAVLYRGHLSPTMATEDVTIRRLGLMMAGQTPEDGAADAP